MLPVPRAFAPVAALSALVALACATRPPTAPAPPANGSARPPLEAEQPTGSVATAKPESTQPELRCEELDSVPDEPGSGARWEILSVLVRTAETPRDVECVQRTIQRFFPLVARVRPPPRDPAALPEWWRTIGNHRYYANDDPKVFVVLPEPVPSLRQAAQRRLAPLLCPKDDGSCAVEARIFLTDAEEEMAELASLQRLQLLVENAREAPEDASADCANEAKKERREVQFAAWRGCVTNSVPQLVRAPSDSFRMPTQGIVTAHRSDFWDPCAEVTGFALASGLALTEVNCRLLDTNRSVHRWRLSRVSPSGVRRVALFIALMDEMRTAPAFAAAIPVPADIPRDDHAHGYARSRGRWISDVPTFDYSMSGVLAKTLSGSVYAYHEIEPRKRLLARLLRTVHAIGTASCASNEEQPVLAELLAKMFPRSPDLRSMEKQVSETVACR